MTVIKSGFGGKEKGLDGASLRFRSDNANFLSKTFILPGKQHTFSFWMRRGPVDGFQYIFGTQIVATSEAYGVALASGQLHISAFVAGPGFVAKLQSKQKLLDPTAWYHCVIALDTPNAVPDERIRMFVNGQRITTFDSRINPSKDLNVTSFAARTWAIGLVGGSNLYKFDGLLSEFHLVDGQALDASAFGTTDADGVWVPKKYAGPHGPTGFYFPFSGTDYKVDKSGSGNSFDDHNFNTSPGKTNDVLKDFPTVKVPMLNLLSKSASAVLYDCGFALKGVNASAYATANFPSSGKYYFEVEVAAWAGNVRIGICNTAPSVQHEITYQSDGKKNVGGVASAYGATYGQGAIIGVAVDCDGGNVTFYKSGAVQGSIAFSAASLSSSDIVAMLHTTAGGDNLVANFGQTGFLFPVPAGYRALYAAKASAGGSIKTSGTFTGNANADGPYVWLNGNPETLTINGHPVVWGTHAEKTSGGFKVITALPTHNAAGSNTYSVTATGKLFGDLNHTPGNAQLNP